MHWTNIGLILVAGIHLALAILVLLKNPKHKINITFSLGVFSVSAWVLITALFRQAPADELVEVLFFGKIFFGLLLVSFFQIFTIFFPYQKKRVNLFAQFLILLPTILSVFVITLLPQYIVNEILLHSGQNLVVVNKIFWGLYCVAFTLPMIIGISRLAFQLKEDGGFARIQLGFILVSFLISGLFAWIFNIILPFFDNFMNDWIGAMLSVIFSFIVVYFVFFGGKKIYIR